MSEDTKNTQTALKEALVLFEASFVQYTKKPTQGNIDELISAGQTYKELWIMAISDGSMAGNIEKLNKTLALSSRKLDYEKSDEINTKLENLDATQEEHEATLKKAVDDSFDTSDTDGKWSLKQVSAIQRRDRAERLQGHFSGNDLYRRTISANESRLGLSNFSDESLELLPFKSLKNIQDNAVIQKTISATATIATSRNRIPKMIASNVRKATNSKYETVPINLITPSKLKDGGLGFDEDSPESIKVLMKNISEFGIKEPIHVYSNASIETKSNGELLYKVLDGDRRLEAARILGYKEIPVAINSIGVVSEHEFISHNISARGYRESGKPYTRRWYYEQPSPSTLLTWRDQVKSHDNEQSRALLDVIDKDIAIKGFLNKLSKHISKGASFEGFAKLHSQHSSYFNGGISDWIEVNNATVKMLDSLKNNEVSETYLTDFGFAIAIKLEERFVSSNLKKCKENLVYLNAEKFYSNWVKGLQERAYIKIYYDAL